MMQQVVGKNNVSNFFANTTSTLSEHAFGSALSPDDIFNFLMSLLKYLVIVGKGFTQTLEVTSRQHTIDAVIADFTKGKGMPSQFTEMAQWPTHKGYLVSLAQQQLINWLHPLKSPGLLTLTKATELHENNVKNTYGYQEKPKIPRA